MSTGFLRGEHTYVCSKAIVVMVTKLKILKAMELYAANGCELYNM